MGAHLVGFLPPIAVAPLVIGAVDFVWVLIALAWILMVWAGWIPLSPLVSYLNDISILGFRPFTFIG
jgi:hypothetical protein